MTTQHTMILPSALRMLSVRRIEERDTGRVRYCLDEGQPQLLGPWYETRADAEAAYQMRADTLRDSSAEIAGMAV